MSATFKNEAGEEIEPETLKAGDVFTSSNCPGRTFKALAAWDSTTNEVGGSIQAENVVE